MSSIYLTAAELKTNVEDEVVALISRADPDIMDDAIASAIGETKSYLSRYDLDALFGKEATTNPVAAAVPPTVTDANLKRKVKEIAVFNFMSLANVNHDMTVIATSRDNAVRWLRDVQSGKAAPDWPYKETSAVTFPQGLAVHASYNERKTNRI